MDFYVWNGSKWSHKVIGSKQIQRVSFYTWIGRLLGLLLGFCRGCWIWSLLTISTCLLSTLFLIRTDLLSIFFFFSSYILFLSVLYIWIPHLLSIFICFVMTFDNFAPYCLFSRVAHSCLLTSLPRIAYFYSFLDYSSGLMVILTPNCSFLHFLVSLLDINTSVYFSKRPLRVGPLVK